MAHTGLAARFGSTDAQGRQVIGRFTGPGLPFGPSEASVLGPKDDISVIVTSMAFILTTPKGSLPYAPQRGSIVPSLIFEPYTEVTLGLIRYFTAKDLSEQEPRIVVRGVFSERTGTQGVRVIPAFQLVGDPIGNVHNAPLVFSREVA